MQSRDVNEVDGNDALSDNVNNLTKDEVIDSVDVVLSIDVEVDIEIAIPAGVDVEVILEGDVVE